MARLLQNVSKRMTPANTCSTYLLCTSGGSFQTNPVMLVEALKVKTCLFPKIWSPSGAVLKMQLRSVSPSGTNPLLSLLL